MAVSAKPPRPTKVEASRVSDGAQKVKITHGSTSAANAVEKTIVYRRTIGPGGSDVVLPGVDPGGDFVRVATLSGKVSSWDDFTTRPNRKYTYEVKAFNSKGYSDGRTSNTLYTTPATPDPWVTRLTSSSALVDYLNSLDTGSVATRVDVREDGGAASTQTLPWTDTTSSNLADHQYDIRAHIAVTDPVNGSYYLHGPWKSAPLLKASAPPAAPTVVSPGADVYVSSASAVPFEWVHNALDGTAQSAYELRYRVGAGAFTTLTGTTASSRSVTLATNAYGWQVRTKGGHASFGDWSDEITVTVIDPPTVTVTGPVDPLDTAYPVATWSYAQAQSQPQTEWSAQLILAGEVLETLDGDSDALAAEFATVLDTGVTYTVEVVVGSSGVMSVPDDVTFTTAIVPPPDPSVTGVWDEELGVVQVSAAAGVGSPATVRLVLERSLDLTVWEPVTAVDGTSIAVDDGASLSFGITHYRVTAYTVKGGKAVGAVNVVSDSPSVWLSGGDDFTETARLPLNPEISIQAGRNRAVMETDTDGPPIAFAGPSTKQTVSMSGWVVVDEGMVDDLSVEAARLREIAMMPAALHLHRDPDGHRVYGSLSVVDTPRVNGLGYWSYSYSLTEARA